MWIWGAHKHLGFFIFSKHIFLKQSALLTVQSQALWVSWFLLIRGLPCKALACCCRPAAPSARVRLLCPCPLFCSHQTCPVMCFPIQNVTWLHKRQHGGPVLSGFESQFFQFSSFLKKALKGCLTSLCLGFFIWKIEIIIACVP